MTACAQCGGPLPEGSAWSPSRAVYCSRACQQKAYRARRKAGTVIPQRERQRRADQKRLVTAERELQWARDNVRRAQAEVRRLQAVVQELNERVSTQLQLGDWKSQVGTVTDEELADRHGLALRTVRRERRRQGVAKAGGA